MLVRIQIRVRSKRGRFSIRKSLLPPRSIGGSDLPQKLEFIEALACSFRDRAQRIFGHMDGQAGFFAQKLVEPAQERAAACEHQAAIHQIGGQVPADNARA